MPVKTNSYRLEEELTLRTPTGRPVTVHQAEISLTRQDEQVQACHLDFEVDLALYQKIEAQALFNLKPEVRGRLFGDRFSSEAGLNFSTLLNRDFLSLLPQNGQDVEAAAIYLQQQSRAQAADPLLLTESWICLSVTQQQEQDKTGYRTAWDYFNLSAIAQGRITGDEIIESLIAFFKESVDPAIFMNDEDIADNQEVVTAITRLFQALTAEDSSPLNQTAGERKGDVAYLAGVLEKQAANGRSGAAKTSDSASIFEALIQFLQQDNWPFEQVEAGSIIRTRFQGENGEWECYAQAHNEREQLAFYSLVPFNAPQQKRRDVAELLARANYDLIIGNFEMDFSDGEIRYKTSIDVEGSRLDLALIKNLVYANVIIMDKYLPGITAVIYGNVSPEKAIARIEAL